MRTGDPLPRQAQAKEKTGNSPRGDMTPAYGIQHILVGVDGPVRSAICIEYALSLATTFDAAVTLLHVMEHHDDDFGPHSTDALGWELARQEARARLERLGQDAARTSGRRVDVRLEQGRPAERIVALAREVGADLVVLGSHDQDEHPSWGLGSTAQKVLLAACSSVLIARGSGASPTFVPPKRILVPLDGSLRTESVLPTATSIAVTHGAQLVLVHVVADPMPTGILAAPADLQLARDLATRLEHEADRYLGRIRHHVNYDESLVLTQVARKVDQREFLVELSVREQIDLIVLSAHGSTCNVERPFGSVTAHLLTHSKVPVLVVQDLPTSELRSDGEADERRAPPPRGTYPPELA